MRVNEILVEDKKQIDEALPLAALLTFPAITTAISGVLAGWTVVELVQFLGKYGDDPTGWPDEKWEGIFFDVLLIAVPVLGSKVISKLIPSRLKIRAARWLKSKILTKWRQSNAAKFARKKRGVTDPSKLRKLDAKQRLANINAMKKADTLVNNLPSKVMGAFKIGIGLNIAHDYYKKISFLDEEWEQYQKGNRKTKTFGNSTQQEAVEIYNRQKNKFWGEFVTIAGAAIAALPAAKAVSFVGSTLGTLTGKGFVGGLVQLPFAAAASLISLTGFSLALFTQTQAGQQLLTHTLGKAMGVVGGGVTYLIDLAQKAANEIAEKLGVKLNLQPTKKPEPADELQSKMSNKEYLDYLNKTPASLRRTVNNTNPKIIYIGGVQVTDQNGVQLVPDSYLDGIRRKAEIVNIPDPTAGIIKQS